MADSAAIVQRGKALEAAGKYAEAVAEYTKAVEAAPLDATNYALRGWARHLQGDHQEAWRDLTMALQTGPDDARIRLMRGLVLRDLDRPKEAVEDFAAAARLDPTSARAPGEQAMTLYKLRDHAGAVAAATEAIKRNGALPGYYQVRALAYEKLDRLPEALADVAKADSLTSDAQQKAALAEIRRRVVAAQSGKATSTESKLIVSAEPKAEAGPRPAPPAAARAVPTRSDDDQRVMLAVANPGDTASAPAPTAKNQPSAKKAPSAPVNPPAGPSVAGGNSSTATPAEVEGEWIGQWYNLTNQYGDVRNRIPQLARDVAVKAFSPELSLAQTVPGDRFHVVVTKYKDFGFDRPDFSGTSFYVYQFDRPLSEKLDQKTVGRMVNGSGWTAHAGWLFGNQFLPPALPQPDGSYLQRFRQTGGGAGNYLDQFMRLKAQGDTLTLDWIGVLYCDQISGEGAQEVRDTTGTVVYHLQARAQRAPARKTKDMPPGFELFPKSAYGGGVKTLPLPPEYGSPVLAKIMADIGATATLELQTDPAGKKELRADGRDGVLVKVRVPPKADAAGAAASLAATQGITFAAVGDSAKWVDLSEAQMRDDWKAIYVQATNPDPVRGGANQPPATLQIRAQARDGNRSLSRLITLDVPPEPAIDAKPDLVEFAAQSGQSAQVQIAIDNPGPDPWDIRAEYEPKSRPLATVEVKRLDGKSAQLALKEAGLDPLHDGSNDERAVLRIIAEQKDRAPLERDVKVAVAQEGLFVSTTGRDPNEALFRLRGDGSGKATEIDFRVFVLDPATKKMVNLARRPGTLAGVTVECLELKGSVAANVLEAAHFIAEVAEQPRPLNEPAGILRLSLGKEVPADGRIIPCDFRITYGGRSEDAFSAIVTVGIVTTADGPGSDDWRVERARCQEIINRFVPAAYYPRMQAMLDQRQMTLGPQGLRELRRKIWSAATELTLGEGGAGYASEAAWAGAITETLEWSQWAGDMAFNAVIGTWTGPYGTLGASSLKGAVISAINAYQEGQSAEEWLWGNLATIPGLIEGKIVDPDTFASWGMESKAKAWAVYIGYHFCKNLYNGATVIDALKNTAKEAGGNVLGAWLGEEVRKNGSRPVTSWIGDKGRQLTAAVTPPAVKPAGVPAPAAEPAKASAPAQAAVPKAAKTAAAKSPAEGRANGTIREEGSDTGSGQRTPMKAVAAESEPQPKSATAAGETASPDQAAPAQKAPASEAERRVASADQTTAAKAQPAEPETVAPKPAAEPTAAQEAESAALVRRHATERPDGTRYAHPDDVLAIMRDTTMVRALKKAPEDVQLAFSNTRESIYRQHDATVEQHVKDTVPGMKDRIVRVLEFRTPGETGFSLNTDRDYRVCYYAGFDAHGDPQWIEVPRQHWEAKSYETFAKLTGGPTDSPEASKEWAAELQQLATDKYHPEASPAFSDQKTIWNPLIRKFEKIQVTANFTEVSRYPGLDPKSAGTLPKLEDPQALGHMYEMKVGDARQTPEKYVQANKAVEAFVAVRKSYNVQGRQIGVVSDKVLAGMDAVAKVARQLKADPNCRDPIAVAEGEKTLRDLGFQDMKDFMNKLSSQFESLKTMSAPPPARPNPGKS